ELFRPRQRRPVMPFGLGVAALPQGLVPGPAQGLPTRVALRHGGCPAAPDGSPEAEGKGRLFQHTRPPRPPAIRADRPGNRLKAARPGTITGSAPDVPPRQPESDHHPCSRRPTALTRPRPTALKSSPTPPRRRSSAC